MRSEWPGIIGQSPLEAKCVTMPNFVAIDRTVAEIWRFDGFQNGGRPQF